MDYKFTERPFALLSYVARQFLEISKEDWQMLGEEEKKEHIRSANRALNAAKQFSKNEDVDG